MNKILTRITAACLTFAMGIGVGVAVGLSNKKPAKALHAANSGIAPTANTFVIDFYDSTKLSSTSGTGLSSSNYASFVRVPDGLTATDVVTGVSVTGTVQYGKNGGLTAGTSSASSQNSHYVTFAIDEHYPVTKCTVYATAYETGRWLLNGDGADDGTLGAKGAEFSTVTDPFVWNNLEGINSLTFKKDDGDGGNQKRLTIYTIVCEFNSKSLTGLRIASGESSVKKSYEEGESFDPTGLVIQAKWDETWDEENNVLDDVVWTPNPLPKNTTSVTGTYTYGSDDATVTVSGLTVIGPDVILSTSNKPFTSTSNSNTNEENVTLDGIQYHSYAAYIYNNYLSFNRDQAGAYLGNNTGYAKNISKIVVDYYSGGASYFKMYEGSSALAETTEIAPSSDSTGKITYTFNDEYQFFKLKLVTTGTYCNIRSIAIYWGTTHVDAEISSVVASIKDGTYYAGLTLNASDFNVTVTWTGGKEDTHPTEGFTWTVNGTPNGTLNEGDNSVVVTYGGENSAAFNVVGSIEPASSVIARTEETSSSLAYSDYHQNSVSDTFDYEYIGVSGTGYKNWNKNGSTSGVAYAGESAGGNSAIQLRSTNPSGIVSKASGGRLAKVTITWNSHTASDRKLDIYGKNTAYNGPADLYNNATQGTKLGTLNYDADTELVITGSYSYIGIRSNNGALYLDSVVIEWTAFTYDDLAIRFTGSVDKELFDRLDTESTITGYGMLLSTASFLEDDDLKDYYELADDVDVRLFTNADTVHGEKATPTLKEGRYVWNLFKRVSLANATKEYVAVAYIQLNNGERVFLQQENASVKSLAQDLIAGPDRDENSLGGSLGYLANL